MDQLNSKEALFFVISPIGSMTASPHCPGNLQRTLHQIHFHRPQIPALPGGERLYLNGRPDQPLHPPQCGKNRQCPPHRHRGGWAAILAIEEVEDYIPYRVRRGMGKDLFALRVKGESMVNAAILDGDIIIARRTPVAANGEIVVALVGDEATVKTFYKENGHFRLQPENDTMDPIIVEEVAILGKVISVLRFFE